MKHGFEEPHMHDDERLEQLGEWDWPARPGRVVGLEDPDRRDDGRHGPTVMLGYALLAAVIVAALASSLAIVLATL